jgi:hypothetical protein
MCSFSAHSLYLFSFKFYRAEDRKHVWYENMEFVYFHIKIEKPKLGIEKWKDFGILICHSFWQFFVCVPFFLLGKNGTVYYLYYTPHPIHSFLGSFFKEPPPALQNFLHEMLMILQQWIHTVFLVNWFMPFYYEGCLKYNDHQLDPN